MRATTIHAPGDIRFEEVPDPVIEEPTDAIVRVTAGCVCGSDLWPYRGANPIDAGSTIGHECVGIVEQVGDEVSSIRVGDFVIVPFCHCDNTCAHCRAGVQSACERLGFTSSGQGELVRATQADGSLKVADDPGDDVALTKSLLTLSDVMPTGWHAAVAADVQPGSTAVVVGDGAVGLCGVLAARTMGAGRVVAMSRHEPRQQVARSFGATDVLAERGTEAVERIRELTDGVGADHVLECVGTDEAMRTAIRAVRPGGGVGFVGVPHDVSSPVSAMFRKNVRLAGGVAPVRRYLDELLPLVLDGTIDPGIVFDLVLPMSESPEAYRAMDERRAIKVMLQP